MIYCDSDVFNIVVRFGIVNNTYLMCIFPNLDRNSTHMKLPSYEASLI
jgi:hypothetical protein